MPLDKPAAMRTSGFNIIDRRPTTTTQPGGKSGPNRQRMDKRVRGEVMKKLAEGIRSTTVLGGDSDSVVIEIPSDKLAEPVFRHDPDKGDSRDYVLPGNKIYEEGDRIKRPQSQQGGGGGNKGGQGEGQDSFRFVMDRKKFMELLFDGMSLPNLEDVEGPSHETKLQRAGHTTSGPSERLDLPRTAGNALARRIALRRPKKEAVKAAEDVLEELRKGGDSEAIAEQEALVGTLKSKQTRIPWMDTGDQKFRRYETVEKPNTQAVMFCLMDVSGSMAEREKTIAKAFFMATNEFLKQKYDKVAIVFIRHTEKAFHDTEEKDFFESKDTGGTQSSVAFKMAGEIAGKKYPASSWNRYFAYAGDGDNDEKPVGTAAKAIDDFLKQCKYGVYLEVKAPQAAETSLMREFKTVATKHPAKLSLQRANDIAEVHPALRRMFTFKENKSRMAAFGPSPVAAAAFAAPAGP